MRHSQLVQPIAPRQPRCPRGSAIRPDLHSFPLVDDYRADARPPTCGTSIQSRSSSRTNQIRAELHSHGVRFVEAAAVTDSPLDSSRSCSPSARPQLTLQWISSEST